MLRIIHVGDGKGKAEDNLFTKYKNIFVDEKKKRLNNILETNIPFFHVYYLTGYGCKTVRKKQRAQGDQTEAFHQIGRYTNGRKNIYL